MARRRRKKNISGGTGIAIGVVIGLGTAGAIWGVKHMYGKKKADKALPGTNGNGAEGRIPPIV